MSLFPKKKKKWSIPLTTKRNTLAAAKARENCWQKITDVVNAYVFTQSFLLGHNEDKTD